jgi:hypothetical protein
MIVTSKFPAGPDVELETLLAELTGAERLSIGDERIRDFLTRFSRKLLRPELARRFPELGSLGFFLRPAEVVRALKSLEAGGLRFPRGLIFHVPPANVDTIFVYSWALSALAGNANVVRLSDRAGEAAQAVLGALNEALAEADPIVARTQRIIGYPRDDKITAKLSAACDLRVIWGGDAAVTDIRRHPLSPHARDLTFPDRSSFAAIRSSAWHAALEREKQAAVAAFAADAYWFDQAACSSPRTIFWVGDPGEAPAEFEALLAANVAERGWGVDAAMAVEKRVATYGMAADGVTGQVRFHGNAVAGFDLDAPAELPRTWLGAGTFAHSAVGSLSDLVRVVNRKDQTMSVFGFPAGELRDFVTELGGRGIDRIVPFGSALSFAAVWDGYDLLTEFTRQTTITV